MQAISLLARRSPRNILPDRAMFAVMKAYLDGSANTRMMTLACLVASDADWSRLESAWADVLAERGRGLKAMHMTYAMNLEEQFHGWDSQWRDHLVDGLLRALENTRANKDIRHFGCTIDLQGHQYWSKRRKLPSAPRLIARNVVELLLRWLMFEWKNDLEQIVGVKPLELIFDRNEPFLRHISQDCTNPRVRKEYPELEFIASAGWAVMETTPALQMADVIAWGRNRVESTNIQTARGREVDPHYATAFRAANAVFGRILGIPSKSLALDPYPEKGFLKLYGNKSKGKDPIFNVKNTSEEYKRFDRMMRGLMAAKRSDIQAKLEAEKAARKRKKAKQSSASRVASDRE